MAVDPLFEGIVSINVEDNDAPGRLGAIIQQLQAKMAELGNLPGVQLGEQIFGGVETGAKATLTVIDQLKVALTEMNAAGRGMLTNESQFGPEITQMREMVAGTEAVIIKLRELMVVQQEQQLAAAKGVAIAGVVTPAEQRAAAFHEQYPAGIINPRDLAPIVPIPEPRNYVTGQAALTGDQRLAAMGLQMSGGVAVPISVSGGGLEEQAAARAAAAEVTGTATALSKAQADNAAADIGVVKATQNLEKAEIDAEVRIQGLLKAWSTSMGAQLRLEKAMNAEAVALEKAAATPVVPVNLSGVDPAQSARVQQLQLDLATNVAKEQTLLAARKGAVTEVELAQARIRTLAVEERLTAAMEKQAAEASGGTGGGGGFGGGMSSLHMLKYYAFFMAFQEGSRLLTDVKKATEEYSLAVNQLSIALGGNQERAQSLAATYSTIGQNLATAPTIAVDAATKYTRFFQDTSGVSGDIGARLGSTVNILEGAKVSGAFGDPAARAIANDKTLGELAAIARNYELGAQGAANLYDAATVIAQQYGLGESQGGKLVGGTAQIADLFKQSGFTAEQGLALTGSVMQYTGNTSEMAAGDLKRFLGRQGSSTFKNIFAEFSIDQNQTLRGELVDLGAKFKDLSETQRASIVSALGGGRAGAAVVAAITDLPSQTAVAAKGADSVGVAFEQAQLRLGTFAGKLEQISADWSTLAKDLGTSGLGSVFGDALALVDPLLRGVDMLVSGFALLPGYVKDFLEVLALASVAGRVFGGSFGLEGVTGMLTKVGNIGGGAAEVEQTAARVAATAAIAAETEAQAALAAARVATTVATIADGASSTAATEAIAAQALAEEALAATSAAATEAVAAQTVVAGASTTGLVVRLGALAGAAGGAALAIAPFVAMIAEVAAFGEVWKSYGQAKSAIGTAGDAFAARAAAQTPDEIMAAAALAYQSSVGLQSSREGIGGGLLYGLNSGTNDPRFFGGGRMNPGPPNTPAGLNKQADDLQRQLEALYADNGGLNEPRLQFEALQKSFAQPGGSGAAQNFGLDYTDVDRGIRNLATLHASVASSMATLRDELAHIPDSSLADFFTPQTGKKGVGDELKRLTTQIGHSNNPIQNEADLGQISSLTGELAKRAAGTGQEDAAAAFYDTALKAYHQAVLGNVKAKVDSIHAMASDNARSQAQIRGTVTAALTEFAATGDVNSVVALLAGVDKAFITTFNANIAAERQVLADQAMALEAAAGAAANVAIAASTDPRQQAIIANRNISTMTPAERATQDKIARDVKIAATMAAAAPLTAPAGSDFTWPKDKSAAAGSGPTAAQIEEARLAAQAIPGDPMSAAITNLRVAQYKMSEPKNQVEYWTALKALHDAQYAYSMAQQSAANDATQLREDLTNPLVVAREKVREAQRQLAADLSRGALPDVTNKDRLALKQAQSAAEKTAFDQKFSDESTNYNLQRISLQAYLSYLNAQHNYLTSVHSKTRQQVDELNQVDQALQGLANQLQGQFNLGQIKVPTAYEARAIGAGGLTTNVQITINGTDIPAVKAILTQYLGQAAMSTAGSSARKV